MKYLSFVALIGLAALTHVLAQSTNSEPPSTESKTCDCDIRIWTCSEPRDCAHGLVPDTSDPCACCQVCGNEQYQFCDIRTNISQIIPGQYFPYKKQFGLCGNGLVCKTNFDVSPGSNPENICFCDDEETVCGSNEKTYDNICHLREKNIQTKSKVITETSRGRCPGVPKIVTSPDPKTNTTGGRILMHCEILAYPNPVIEWRKEGVESRLPGDRTRMTIHTTGGPEPFEHTSFLQIIELELEDEGDYKCVAKNEFGNDTAGARLIVTHKNQN